MNRIVTTYCTSCWIPAVVHVVSFIVASSYSPNVYDGAIGEYRGILNYWGVEDTGIVTAKNDEQKTDATRSRILELAGKL